MEGSLENDTTESTEIATSILDEILDRVQSHVQVNSQTLSFKSNTYCDISSLYLILNIHF